MALYLIEKGADVNREKSGGWMPLNVAESELDLQDPLTKDVIAALVQRGARKKSEKAPRPDKPTDLKLAALINTLYSTYTDSRTSQKIDELLALGADINHCADCVAQAVSTAAGEGNVQVLTLLKAKGVNFSGKAFQNSCLLDNAVGSMVEQDARAAGSVREAIELLIDYGATAHCSPLAMGVLFGSGTDRYNVGAALKTLQFLKSKGIDLNDKNSGGKNLLDELLGKNAEKKAKFQPLIAYLQSAK